MKTSSAKAKGRRLQQWVGQKIANLTGFNFGPNEMIASREMGQSGTDIRLIADALDAFPYSVECKNQERINIWDSIRQARANKVDGTNWLLFFTRNREDVFVCLSAQHFFDILGKKNPRR